jgi:hypothetical protein
LVAIVAAATGFLLSQQAGAVAAGEPAFGPGSWTMSETGPFGAPRDVGRWQVAADCGTGCLTVSDGDNSAKFEQNRDGAWIGGWHIVDGDCYDDFGNTLPATATYNSHFVVNPDLTVIDHVVDLVGCDGGSGFYDAAYTLTMDP